MQSTFRCSNTLFILLLLLMTMTVITRARPDDQSSERINTSQQTLRSDIENVTLPNVTRLYPVPDHVPETINNNTNTIKLFLNSIPPEQSLNPENSSDVISTTEPIPSAEKNPSFTTERSIISSSQVSSTFNEEISSREIPQSPTVETIIEDVENNTGRQEYVTPALETLSDESNSNVSNPQYERSEREIRKKSTTTQNFEIEFHPSYELDTDGLNHDKLTHQTRDFIKKISTTSVPVFTDYTPEIDYTIFVTPSQHSLSNDLKPLATTTSDVSSSSTITSITLKDIVLASSIAPKTTGEQENISKIKDKTDVKPKFSSKIKQTTNVKANIKNNSQKDSSEENFTLNTQEVKDIVTKPIPYSTYPSPSTTQEVEEGINSNGTTPVFRKSNSSVISDYELMNDSPDLPTNSTEVAFDTTATSMISDYEELNSTSTSLTPTTTLLNNSTGGLRASAHGRMLDVNPQAHAEDLAEPWNPDTALNIAVISGISFGAIVIVTLLGAISFVMYRRYRWNKPQTLSDKYSNPDSSGYIDDSTLRENSEEMYSLDNDSFLNSLEAMTIQNYWTDHVKHTKL